MAVAAAIASSPRRYGIYARLLVRSPDAAGQRFRAHDHQVRPTAPDSVRSWEGLPVDRTTTRYRALAHGAPRRHPRARIGVATTCCRRELSVSNMLSTSPARSSGGKRRARRTDPRSAGGPPAPYRRYCSRTRENYGRVLNATGPGSWPSVVRAGDEQPLPGRYAQRPTNRLAARRHPGTSFVTCPAPGGGQMIPRRRGPIPAIGGCIGADPASGARHAPPRRVRRRGRVAIAIAIGDLPGVAAPRHSLTRPATSGRSPKSFRRPERGSIRPRLGTPSRNCQRLYQ